MMTIASVKLAFGVMDKAILMYGKCLSAMLLIEEDEGHRASLMDALCAVDGIRQFMGRAEVKYRSNKRGNKR